MLKTEWNPGNWNVAMVTFLNVRRVAGYAHVRRRHISKSGNAISIADVAFIGDTESTSKFRGEPTSLVDRTLGVEF